MCHEKVLFKEYVESAEKNFYGSKYSSESTPNFQEEK